MNGRKLNDQKICHKHDSLSHYFRIYVHYGKYSIAIIYWPTKPSLLELWQIHLFFGLIGVILLITGVALKKKYHKHSKIEKRTNNINSQKTSTIRKTLYPKTTSPHQSRQFRRFSYAKTTPPHPKIPEQLYTCVKNI